MSEMTVEVEGRTLRISNLDKVIFPESGTTKGEVLHYYARIAPVLLPHLADRAVTRIRWPDGTASHQFFEKNAPAGAPSWLRRVRVASTGSRGGGDHVDYPVVDSVAGLTYLANLASLELHAHQWRFVDDAAANPDRLVIDLDPGPPAGLGACCTVALAVRDRLADLGLATAPVSSGSKGLHLYAALTGEWTSAEVSEQAQAIAQELSAEQPDLVVWRMTKNLRPGKVFLDWSQNVAAKTTISPYSLRGRGRPYVAAPRTWAEIEAGAEDPEEIGQLLMDEVLDRVASDGDLFAALLT